MKPWLVTYCLYWTERGKAAAAASNPATAATSSNIQRWQQPLSSWAMAIFAKRSRRKQAAPSGSDGRHNGGGKRQARQQQQQPALFPFRPWPVLPSGVAEEKHHRQTSAAISSGQSKQAQNCITQGHSTGLRSTMPRSGNILKFLLKTVSCSAPCWLADP